MSGYWTNGGDFERPEKIGRSSVTVSIYNCKFLVFCHGWPDGNKQEFEIENVENKFGKFIES